MFELDARLQNDTLTLGAFPLSMVLLSKDANYPWCILAPQRDNIREIHQLNSSDQQQLLKESCCLAQTMEGLFHPIKMNVAALGNIVPQLHLRHIARVEEDAAWPKPIWGEGPAKDYEISVLEDRVDKLQQALSRADLMFEASMLRA